MVYGSVYGSVAESTGLDNVEPYEFDESMSFTDMEAQTLEESITDWNNMMRAIGITELSYVAETGQELIYEAVDFKALGDKFVKWFWDLWAKIQGIANAALAKFASFGKDGDAFISKYGDRIKVGYDNLPDGFTFKGYKFNDANIDKAINDLKSSSDNAISDASIEGLTSPIPEGQEADYESYRDRNFTEEDVDTYRAAIVPGLGAMAIAKGDFAKALNKSLRGSDAKVSMTKADINLEAVKGHVKGAKTAIDGAKESRKALKKSIDDCIKKVKQMSSDASKAGNKNDATIFTNYASYLKKIQTVNTTWFSNYIKVLSDRNRQSKALCVKLVQYGATANAKAKHESASILEDRFAAIFD